MTKCRFLLKIQTIPQTRTVSYYNSFLSSAIQLWNGLSLETKCIESFHTFKNVLKKPAVERTKALRFLIMAVARKI